ncbi:unnamed protein product [Clavelina lepadiformis]|uniref:Uncharacterized protein n=1 Tax=Clavelina lepadiformis TaxID=159417 RepID=A0ABP0GHF2_CLALP
MKKSEKKKERRHRRSEEDKDFKHRDERKSRKKLDSENRPSQCQEQPGRNHNRQSKARHDNSLNYIPSPGVITHRHSKPVREEITSFENDNIERSKFPPYQANNLYNTVPNRKESGTFNVHNRTSEATFLTTTKEPNQRQAILNEKTFDLSSRVIRHSDNRRSLQCYTSMSQSEGVNNFERTPSPADESPEQKITRRPTLQREPSMFGQEFQEKVRKSKVNNDESQRRALHYDGFYNNNESKERRSHVHDRSHHQPSITQVPKRMRKSSDASLARLNDFKEFS